MSADFEIGQRVHWIGLTGQFDRIVTIVRGYRAYLTILGERPEDGRQVYDIHDPYIGGTVFCIPAGQLRAAS